MRLTSLLKKRDRKRLNKAQNKLDYLIRHGTMFEVMRQAKKVEKLQNEFYEREK